MPRFLASEKERLIPFKATSRTFSVPARADGCYKGHTYPFCLPADYAHENLEPSIRDTIRAYFARNAIKWHDGQGGNPSNHLCDSQVCCANFLFPFADKPAALAALLRPLFPTLNTMLPIEIEDGLYVAFEWIGEQNYLREKITRNGKRTRGANFTSADAAVMFQHRDGRRQICLIEWKYTESYYPTYLGIAPSGTDRRAIYRHLYDAAGCPLARDRIPNFDALFYEPFYQFMRQQFLAHEMEQARELGADIVSLLHIAPRHNEDFRRITSPALSGIADSATGVWSRLVTPADRFRSVYTEDLFGPFDAGARPDLTEWKTYITERYAWITS